MDQAAVAKTSFPCAQCGAKLEFQPGAATLKCPYCSHENAIEQTQTQVIENDFRAMLDTLEAAAPREEHNTVKCDACAAEVDRPPNVTSFTCPFCGSNIVSQAVCKNLIKPGAVLPFKITRDQATAAFRKWASSRWFAPNALKSRTELRERLQGIYLPYWTYDCKSLTRYEGKRGEHYYETQWVTVVVNGKSQRQPRQVRRTRWYPAAGTVRNTFDDVLVSGGTTLPEKFVRALEPWDLKSVVDYKDDYLAGFQAQSYLVGLKEGFSAAGELMKPKIHMTIRQDIGGDEQMITRTDINYSDITFKHLLLPVWLSTYRFKDKPYRLFINARTGEVAGEHPYSWVKISLTAFAALIVVLIILLLARG